MGLFCAVLSMLLPPRLAHVELKMRLAFQAFSLRQVLVEQYAAFFTKSRTHHAAAAHLPSGLRSLFEEGKEGREDVVGKKVGEVDIDIN